MQEEAFSAVFTVKRIEFGLEDSWGFSAQVRNPQGR